MTAAHPKINFQRKLDQILDEIEQQGSRPSLLLHSCCGPCSSYVVTYLKAFFDLTVFYYNPNIYPEEEYQHRLSEQTRLLRELSVPLLHLPYDHKEFLQYTKGYEKEPEGGARCEKCFELRLQKTCECALKGGFDWFCTTLTVSPHKNAMVINRVGEEIASGKKGILRAQKKTVLWLPSDFKKKEGYKKSIELSRQYGLYRQEYCGCEYAMRDETYE